MRVRWLASLGVAAVVIGLGAWSFSTSVMDSNDSSQATEGMVMPEDSALRPGSASDETAGIEYEGVVVPPLLGGFQLTVMQSDEEALVAVEQLHGRALGPGLDAAWVAHYGNTGEAVLWVSWSADQADARVLLERMTAKIAEGNSPFSGLVAMNDPALEGYELDGMGQRHFYFVAGNALYWLAVRPDLAESVLTDLRDSLVPTPAMVN